MVDAEAMEQSAMKAIVTLIVASLYAAGNIRAYHISKLFAARIVSGFRETAMQSIFVLEVARIARTDAFRRRLFGEVHIHSRLTSHNEFRDLNTYQCEGLLLLFKQFR